jgi:thiamine-phosphate pyrophosphorylase
MVQDKKYLRLFDANVNRCREGLRVLEDSARFVMNKPALYKKLRSLRHSVDKLTRNIYPEMLAVRDSVTDSGRSMKENSKRPGFSAVLAANFRRVEESLRVLEEYGKIICPEAVKDFKAIRYTAYTLEKKVSLEYEKFNVG